MADLLWSCRGELLAISCNTGVRVLDGRCWRKRRILVDLLEIWNGFILSSKSPRLGTSKFHEHTFNLELFSLFLRHELPTRYQNFINPWQFWFCRGEEFSNSDLMATLISCFSRDGSCKFSHSADNDPRNIQPGQETDISALGHGVLCCFSPSGKLFSLCTPQKELFIWQTNDWKLLNKRYSL